MEEKKMIMEYNCGIKLFLADREVPTIYGSLMNSAKPNFCEFK